MQTDVQQQLDALRNEIDSLKKSASIPRDIETAFRTRLNIGGGFYKAGQATLSSGTVTITDSRIKTTSVIVVTSTVSDNPATVYMLGASCSAGSATIFEGSHLSSDTVNYIIIF